VGGSWGLKGVVGLGRYVLLPVSLPHGAGISRHFFLLLLPYRTHRRDGRTERVAGSVWACSPKKKTSRCCLKSLITLDCRSGIFIEPRCAFLARGRTYEMSSPWITARRGLCHGGSGTGCYI